MRGVILAGGRGSRMGGEVPKPLVPIGGVPLILHVLAQLRRQGIDDLLVVTGHRGDEVAAALAGTSARCIETPAAAGTGGRLAPLAGHLRETFLLAWTDGLWDIDLGAMAEQHKGAGRLATVALINPVSRYGVAEISGDRIARFREKPRLDSLWISAGVFIVEPPVLGRIAGPAASWEDDVLPGLASAGQLTAFRHRGFWAGVDTQAEAEAMSALCHPGPPPWGAP